MSYEDDTPAVAASVAITSIDSETQVAVVVADQQGRFAVSIGAGDYAVTATTERGVAWIEKQTVSSAGITIKLTRDCEPTSGRIVGASAGGVQVKFSRHSFASGDTFVTSAYPDGRFAVCLPRGQYTASVAGSLLSTGVAVAVPSDVPVQLRGYLAGQVKSAPGGRDRVPHDLDGLLSDILRAQPLLVGLGEATHGSAEFATVRSKLTFALARRAQLQLVLLENDAIAAMNLERYVNGEDVDLANAVAELGFWTTDTYEFLQFMKDIRAYNEANPRARIHVWGIDAQNTERPTTLLIANASTLRLSSEEQALLQTLVPARGKAVKQFSAEQRAALDTLLLRLSEPAGSSDLDTQLALAARSLVIQVGYMDGDTGAMYSARRDAGMAQLARFVIDRLGVQRACLWAHDGHIGRISQGSEAMGQRLAAMFASKYYPVGFFLYEGTSRAWDAAGKIGVISHELGRAPAFTVESVLLSATSASDVAWVPLRRLSEKLRVWLEMPRYVRLLGAVYGSAERTMFLMNVASAFDAVVVIRTVRDSSPTPTGIRRAQQ